MKKSNARLLTANELATALAVSLSTIRRMTRDGQVPVVRIRGLLRYDLDDVLVALSHVSWSAPTAASGVQGALHDHEAAL